MHVCTIVHGAKQMPYEGRKLLTSNSDDLDEKRELWKQSLEVKRKHIEHAKKYAGDQCVLWWDSFFLDQYKIIDFLLEDQWLITNPFTWLFSISPTLC